MTRVVTPNGEFVVKEHPAVPAECPHVVGCVSRLASHAHPAAGATGGTVAWSNDADRICRF